MIPAPLFDLKVPKRGYGRRCRNFKSATVGRVLTNRPGVSAFPRDRVWPKALIEVKGVPTVRDGVCAVPLYRPRELAKAGDAPLPSPGDARAVVEEHDARIEPLRKRRGSGALRAGPHPAHARWQRTAPRLEGESCFAGSLLFCAAGEASFGVSADNSAISRHFRLGTALALPPATSGSPKTSVIGQRGCAHEPPAHHYNPEGQGSEGEVLL